MKTETIDIKFLSGMAVNILRGEVGNHKSQNELHSFSRGGENRRPEKRIDTH